MSGDPGRAPDDGAAGSDGSVDASAWARPMRGQALWLLGGVGAVILASVVAGAGALGLLLEPPFPAGLLLGAAAGILGMVAVLRAAVRIGPARSDARELIRAVRLLFVAVGLFAAAAGWVAGSALPIVLGLVIVGIDVIETSFLLLVTSARGSATVQDAPTRSDEPLRG